MYSKKGLYMSLPLLIQYSLNSQNTGVDDGIHYCSYANITEIFQKIESYFIHNNISAETCVALECSNSVMSAITLLYMFFSKRSFFLAPSSKLLKNEIPRFCEKRLAIQKSKSSLAVVEDFFFLEKNEQYNNTKQQSEQLFLKTSGSMSKGKIVVHQHSKIASNVKDCIHHYQLQHCDRVMIPIPIFHLYGLQSAFLSAFCARASIDLLRTGNIIEYLTREKKSKPNIAFMTPTLCQILLQHRQKVTNSYRFVATGGDRIKKETFFQFNQRVGLLINQYGSTEMGTIAISSFKDSLENRANYTGKLLSGVEIKMHNGKMSCRSPYSFKGYIDEEGKYTHQHQSHNWFTTGDSAELFEGGYLKIYGRWGNSVNRNGKLVLFSDVEKKIEEFPEVKNVVIIKGNRDSLGQQLTVFCTTRTSITPSELRLRCLRQMPSYAVPTKIFIIKSFPTLPNGKINRQALQKLFKEQSMSEQIIKQLQGIIVNQLDAGITYEDIDPQEALFEDGLGLDSIKIVELINHVENEFSIQFAENELTIETFQNLTTLAQFIHNKQNQ